MTYRQARSKMRKLAEGRAYAVGYSEMHLQSGEIDAKHSLYLDTSPGPVTSILAVRPSWEEVFAAMEREIGKWRAA